MANHDEQIKKYQERIYQLKNQKKSIEQREKAKQRKEDERRNFIVGELVCEYFPELMKYQPKRKRADTIAEFAPVEAFMRELSNKSDIVSQIKNQVEMTIPIVRRHD